MSEERLEPPPLPAEAGPAEAAPAEAGHAEDLPRPRESVEGPRAPIAGVYVPPRADTSLAMRGLILIFLCCAILAYVAHVEGALLDSVPWGHGLARIEEDAPPEGTRPAHLRRIPKDSLPPDTELVAMAREVMAVSPAATADEEVTRDTVISLMGGSLAETVIMFPATEEELSQALDSGRLPVPGKPEVLRGALARIDSFVLDDEKFQVVGRLKPIVGGAAFAYFLPEDATLAAKHFSPAQGASNGWYAPDARKLPRSETGKVIGRIESKPDVGVDADADADAGADVDADAATDAYVDQPFAQTPTRVPYIAGIFIALFFGAAGGYALHAGLFRLAARRRVWLFGRVFSETAARPGLFRAFHILLYGAFFFAMLRGAGLPLNNMAVAQFVAKIFTTGDLGYIGDAYASGNVMQASIATFRNNYVLQTLALTFGISLLPLALGVVKTMFSFVFTGFVMAPIWTHTAAGFTYHSITMVLELEAYIVACFAVTVWAIACFRGLGRVLFAYDVEGPPVMVPAVIFYVEAAILTGLMLAFAALYEATTLILASGA